MSPASGLRHDDWKLIHYYEGDRIELYDLQHDPSELHNVDDTHADVSRRLKDQLDEWRTAVAANAPQCRRSDSRRLIP